ncbi:MAG: hypothetical protein JO294_11670, partial [Alphaproteobacteria bacterium]|nr:hypothetical protein [Alphaproteobacteria bacterium]
MMRGSVARARLGAFVLTIIAGLTLIAFALPSAADVRVNYGEGQYGLYRQQMVGFLQRAEDIEAALHNLYIPTTYCAGDPQRQEDQRTLRDLRRQYNALRDEYRQFRQGLMDLAKDHPDLLTGFDQSEMTPENGNFWVNQDRAMAEPNTLLQQKNDEFDAAKEVDCTPPVPGTTQPPPPPPPPP